MKNAITLYSFLIVITAFSSFHCIENPLNAVLPASDITLGNISLFNTTKTIAELIKADSSLQSNSNGNYRYTSTQTLNPITSFFKLAFSPEPIGKTLEVGLFTVEGMDTISQTLPLNVLNLAPGYYPFFARTSIPLPSYTIQFSSQMQYAAIRDGGLVITVKNRLPMTLGFNSPLIIRNNQDGDHSIIGQCMLPQIDPESSISQTIPLNDKIVRSNITVDGTSCYVENQNSPFTINDGDGIDYQFYSTPLTVDSAVAVIPEQSSGFLQNSNWVLDSLVTLREAECKDGQIQIVLKNNTNAAMEVQVQIDELHNLTTDERYRCYSSVLGMNSVILPVSLNQWKIQTAPGSTGTAITFSVQARVVGSQGTMVRLSQFDNVSAEIRTTSPIHINSARGKINSRTVPVFSTVQSKIVIKNAENYSGTAYIQGIKLQLKMQSTELTCPLDYHLALVAKFSKTNQQDSIILATENGSPRLHFDPAINHGSVSIELSDIPGFDSFISKFFPILPDTFIIRGYLIVNPLDEFQKPDNDCRVAETSTVTPSFDLDVPVSLSMTDGSITERYAVSSEGKMSADMAESIAHGSLILNATNRIPLQMNFRLIFFGHYDKNPHGDTMLIIDPGTTIAAAGINSDGYAIASTYTSVTTSLNAVQIAEYNASDSVCVNITNIATSNKSSIVHLNASDYIKLSVLGNFVYTMNGKQQ